MHQPLNRGSSIIFLNKSFFFFVHIKKTLYFCILKLMLNKNPNVIEKNYQLFVNQTI